LGNDFDAEPTSVDSVSVGGAGPDVAVLVNALVEVSMMVVVAVAILVVGAALDVDASGDGLVIGVEEGSASVASVLQLARPTSARPSAAERAREVSAMDRIMMMVS